MDWKNVYRKNYPLVYAFLTTLGAERHTAEELAQETFCSFMASRKKVEDPILPKLFMRASSRWVNHLKKLREEKLVFQDRIVVESSRRNGMMGPSHVLMEKENQREISLKLNQFPTDDVALLVLVYQGGYTVKAAAELLGIPRSTARRKLEKAAERLLEIIRSEEECQC